MNRITAMLAGLMGISATSCGDADAENEFVETLEVVSDALLDTNALNLNALNLNALNLNALNLNALNLNALNSSVLTSIRRSDLDGELARQLLRYTASCALSPSQYIEVDWIDSDGFPHLDIYWGLMALEPSWSTTPLSDTGARWISACLASRVNWYGVGVLLSSRGSHGMLSNSDASEVADFSMMEGAFWGNLFDASPQVFACHDAGNTSHSRQKMRDCAAGHLQDSEVVECGIIDIVGSCGPRCTPDPGGGTYFQSCSAEPAGPSQTEVITVWLPL